MRTICLSRDNVAALTKTDFPTGMPSFDGDGARELWVYNAWGWPLINTVLTVDAYSDAGWADAAEPAVADHIMISKADRQWKANRWIVGDFGDVMFVNAVVTGELGPSA